MEGKENNQSIEEKELTLESILETASDGKEKENNITDINIEKLEDLVVYSANKEYDFFIIEPLEDKVKISFRKNKVEKEEKFIKFPTYSQILIKAK